MTSVKIVDLNDIAVSRFFTVDPATGLPAAGTSVVCTFTNPAGTTSTPGVTNPATGEYYSTKKLDTVGLWFADWSSADAGSDHQEYDVRSR